MNFESKFVLSVLVLDMLCDLVRECFEIFLGKFVKFCGEYKIFCCVIEEFDFGIVKLDDELVVVKEDVMLCMKKFFK